MGAASGAGACAVLRAGLGVLTGARGLVGWKAEVVWPGGVLEAT